MPSLSTAQPALDVETVRRDFPILHQTLPSGAPLAYLDSAASAQKPRAVIDKITDCYSQYYANAYRGVYHFGARVDEELEAAREKVRRFLGARMPEEIVFTSGTTMSINLVANAWGRKFLQPGDELLLNEMEHHANLVPWQQIAHERGARLRFIPLTGDGRLNLDALDDVLTERTKLVAFTAMSNVLGTLNPIDVLVRRAKQVGALVLVDAAQSVPHQTVNVLEPQVDFLAFSGHKLFGPSGVGVLYGRAELLDAMDPFLCGGHMISEVHRERSEWAELPAKFEAGTLPIAPVIGLGAAIDYVERLGFDAIHAHETRLLQRAHRLLPDVPGLKILGPAPEHKGAIVSFVVDRLHPHDLASLLDQKGIAVRAGHHCTMPLHDHLGITASTRASFAMYNTEAEVDALVDGIRYARKKMRLA